MVIKLSTLQRDSRRQAGNDMHYDPEMKFYSRQIFPTLWRYSTDQNANQSQQNKRSIWEICLGNYILISFIILWMLPAWQHWQPVLWQTWISLQHEISRKRKALPGERKRTIQYIVAGKYWASHARENRASARWLELRLICKSTEWNTIIFVWLPAIAIQSSIVLQGAAHWHDYKLVHVRTMQFNSYGCMATFWNFPGALRAFWLLEQFLCSKAIIIHDIYLWLNPKV